MRSKDDNLNCNKTEAEQLRDLIGKKNQIENVIGVEPVEQIRNEVERLINKGVDSFQKLSDQLLDLIKKYPRIRHTVVVSYQTGQSSDGFSYVSYDVNGIDFEIYFH